MITTNDPRDLSNPYSDNHTRAMAALTAAGAEGFGVISCRAVRLALLRGERAWVIRGPVGGGDVVLGDATRPEADDREAVRANWLSDRTHWLELPEGYSLAAVQL